MDRLENLLSRIRDPRELSDLLLGAPRADAAAVARQLAAVLSSLPALHRELGAEPRHLPAVAELARQLGRLELLALNAAGHRTEERRHGNVH
jgi:hypothetical protein